MPRPVEPVPQTGERGVAAEVVVHAVLGDGEGRAADVVVGQVGQGGGTVGPDAGVLPRYARPAAPVCQTPSR